MSDTVPQVPKALSIADYRQRQERNKDSLRTVIPITQKPKHKRAGKIVRLRKRLATLKEILLGNNPPKWEAATRLWLQVEEIEAELTSHKNKKTWENQAQSHKSPSTKQSKGDLSKPLQKTCM